MADDPTVTAGPTEKPRRRRRWLQFSLRTLLLFALACSILCSWLAVKMQQARKQKAAVAALEELPQFYVVYDFHLEAEKKGIADPEPPGPAWLRRIVGDDVFTTVAEIGVYTQAEGDVREEELAVFLERIKAFTDIRALDLRSAPVSDADLRRLARFGGLEFLKLKDTKVTDDGLEVLKGLPRLQELDLKGTQVTGPGLKHLRGLSRLERLRLDYTKVADDGVENLEGLARLQQLDLASTQVTDAGLKHLKSLTSLRSLDLRNTRVTDAGVNELQQSLPICQIHR